ncbi:hypothetical protein JCM1393_22810 [Clostridium carnis]
MYFIISILFDCIILLGSFTGIFTTAYLVKNKKVKKQYTILISLLLILSSILLFIRIIPKFKDLNRFKHKKYSVYEGECKSIAKNEVSLNGKLFTYNPWDFKPEISKQYTIYYLPNSKFIIKYIEK